MASHAVSSGQKPHVVCVPFPGQGHINPLLIVAKLLHAKGFHVTFVNNVYNHNRLLRSRGPNELDGLPSFRFESIPDGLLETDGDKMQDLPSLCEATMKNCLAPFKELLHRINARDDVPPVSCILADGMMSFTLDAAEELGVPCVIFWTTSACGFLAYLFYHLCVGKGLCPLKDENDLNTEIEWIPTMRNPRLRDLPSFIRTTNPNDIMLNYLSLNRDIDKDGEMGRMGTNLWKEDTKCLDWLDTKSRDSSGVYVNFGSITVMSAKQLVEFAWGLAATGKDFLWVIRPDLVDGDAAVLPPEFLTTADRRMLVTWCPQEKVLAHPAIGGFLTHSGWNSTLESFCDGVPMVCWPFFAEQQTNCKYCCDEMSGRWGWR
ncbi:unnamed protein product [Brassica oleracea]